MDRHSTFASILRSLSDGHRKLLLLSGEDGLSADGIGRVLQMSAAESRIQLFLARRELRERLCAGGRPSIR